MDGGSIAITSADKPGRLRCEEEEWFTLCKPLKYDPNDAAACGIAFYCGK